MKIKVKHANGVGVETAISRMKDLAVNLAGDNLNMHIAVYADFNGVEVSMAAHSDIDSAISEYHKAVGNKMVLTDTTD